LFVVLLAGCDGVFGLQHVGLPPADAPPDAPATYVQAVLADQPVGYFRLGEPEGVNVVNTITDGAIGTFIGTVTHGVPGALTSETDAATSFGANGAADIGDNYDFAGLAPFTLEAWVNPTALDTAFHSIITKWQQPPVNFGYELYYQNDKVTFSREPVVVASEVCASHGLVAGVYTHIVVTFDGASIRLYFNGAQVNVTGSTTVLDDNAQPFQIAAGNNRAFFDGTIDEVAVYDTALSAERINAHYVAASRD
jgi:hypothetical protein